MIFLNNDSIKDFNNDYDNDPIVYLLLLLIFDIDLIPFIIILLNICLYNSTHFYFQYTFLYIHSIFHSIQFNSFICDLFNHSIIHCNNHQIIIHWFPFIISFLYMHIIYAFFSLIVYSNFKLPLTDIPYSLISAKFPNDIEPYFIVGSRATGEPHCKTKTIQYTHIHIRIHVYTHFISSFPHSFIFSPLNSQRKDHSV